MGESDLMSELVLKDVEKGSNAAQRTGRN